MLFHVPGVLTPERLAHFRQQLEQGEWVDGRVTAGKGSARVKSNLQLREHSPVRLQLARELVETLSSHMLFRTTALPQRILPPRFNRYRDGGEYGFHVDNSIMHFADILGDGNQTALRTDISCTLFLSDPDSYDGGELIINDTYGMHQVKLPAGDLIVYPSSSLHRVMPVTHGERLAAIFWVQSKVRDHSQRQLLMQLDTTAQSLAADGAHPDHLLRLQNVYQNLLRQWAEV
jgi:PKHD-type hydroxylase